MTHIPVLLKETIEGLNPQPEEFFIDGTFGAGGHSQAIKEKIGANGKLLAIDWEKTGENFADLPEILEKNPPAGGTKADGLILDLGVSSEQLDISGRGFSFLRDEPLLMTYNPKEEPVRQILTELTEVELFKIIKEYGEERYARRIAKAIYERERGQPILTSGELAKVIANAVPKNYERGRIHPATRTFQALRIYANRELENLERLLQNLRQIIKPGGRVAIISFHSLEDRLVKNYFRDYRKQGKMEIFTKKPIQASKEEIQKNPRSRSAKLRVAKIL
ncbi:MAG: 16S rRNA (cytosine(1402)-N(4))-methyltransferase RsmH [Candidatus Harrisonbacteria bacterium]|nr:16S rRNA (cytosine(1402)-N(4))-methyltransferase RsmH [Candidatus Harrisonbacteria bacterium]